MAALVAQGLSNRRIATELSISKLSAATHARRILKKLGLKSRAQIGSWLAEQPPFSTYPDQRLASSDPLRRPFGAITFQKYST